MNAHSQRIAKGLAAFFRSEGFSLTSDQREALVDQMALACAEHMGPFNYDAFIAEAYKLLPKDKLVEDILG